MKLIIVSVVIVSAIILMRIFLFFIKLLVKKYSDWKKFLNILPLAGFILWIFILLWAVNYLFGDKSYYQVIIISAIVILTLAFGWFFLKDLVAGIIFRLQNNYTNGEVLQIGEISGRLNKMLLTHITIDTNNDNTLKIPYSRLSNEIISQKSQTKSFENNRFTLSTNKKLSQKDTEDAIGTILKNSPWHIGYRLPASKLLNEDDKHYHFEIQLQVRNEKHLLHVKNVLLKKFS